MRFAATNVDSFLVGDRTSASAIFTTAFLRSVLIELIPIEGIRIGLRSVGHVHHAAGLRTLNLQ